MTDQRHRAAVITWDFREQPDLDHLARLVHDLSGGRVHLHHPATGTDDYALIVSTTALDDTAATTLYREWPDSGPDIRHIGETDRG